MIYNLTRKTILSTQTFIANTFRDRFQGMIARKFDNFDAIVFFNCSAIHTFFMRDAIDVLFLSRENEVMKVVPQCMPWRAAVCCSKAQTVIELPTGTIFATRTMIGDFMDLNTVITKETQQSLLSNIIQGNSETAIPCNRENSTR